MSTAKRIAFQGEPGANSHLAISEAYPDCEAVPCATFEDAFALIAAGEADLGMIPVENSVAGRVADIHHLHTSARVGPDSDKRGGPRPCDPRQSP